MSERWLEIRIFTFVFLQEHFNLKRISTRETSGVPAANIKLTLVLSCNLLVMEQHIGILDMTANYLKNTKTLIGEKPNKCNLCNYASSRAGNLRTHLQTHSGEKSNKCNLCDYASSDPSSLRKHLKRHSGEKSNKCNQCDFTSCYASALKSHLKMHSGEKTNKCNLCDYESSQASNLRTHLKTHIKKSPC